MKSVGDSHISPLFLLAVFWVSWMNLTLVFHLKRMGFSFISWHAWLHASCDKMNAKFIICDPKNHRGADFSGAEKFLKRCWGGVSNIKVQYPHKNTNTRQSSILLHAWCQLILFKIIKRSDFVVFLIKIRKKNSVIFKCFLIRFCPQNQDKYEKPGIKTSAISLPLVITSLGV